MDIPSLVNQAVSAFKARDREKAVAAVKQLLALKPPLGEHWGAIARISASMLEAKMAREAALNYARSFPKDNQKQLMAAGVIAEVGYIEDGLKLIAPLAARDTNPALHHFVGMVQSQMGEKEAADKSLRYVLQQWPTSGHTWLMLAAMKKFKKGDPDLAQIKKTRTSMRNVPLPVQIPYYYALGKALLDVKDLDGAMVAFAKGAELMKKDRLPHDFVADRKLVDGLIAEDSKKSFKTLKPGLKDEQRPIFVIGLPRSGTTLLEQILTSHPDVKDGAELNYMANATVGLPGLTMESLKLHEQKMGSENAWQAIGKIYLHLMEIRYGSEGRIIDKSLNNSRYLGLIHHIFPDAPVVWIRRNPLDAAWSCYRTYFNIGMSWTTSFKDIAEYFKAEDDLYKYWTKQYGDKILTVPYEELVSDKDVWFEKIMAHVGLPMVDEIQNFHENKRAVLTASVAQVREPIHTKSVGSADMLGDYIKPFTDAYE